MRGSAAPRGFQSAGTQKKSCAVTHSRKCSFLGVFWLQLLLIVVAGKCVSAVKHDQSVRYRTVSVTVRARTASLGSGLLSVACLLKLAASRLYVRDVACWLEESRRQIPAARAELKTRFLQSELTVTS